MKRSFLRLVVSRVLLFWTIGFVLIFVYATSRSWSEERVRQDGVFLVYQMLNDMPPGQRGAQLQELQQHFAVDMALVTISELEERIGQPAAPGDRIPYQAAPAAHWYFLVFDDGLGVLAAGPVNPIAPAGVVPLGLILGVIGLPLIAALIALRVERELKKVEHASRALAVGELGARVDNPHGPSNELATTFNEMAERIERLIRSRDELVQAVSHELGSPLSRLRFHMELLGSQSEEEQEGRLSSMTQELDALDDLVAELLGYVQSDDLKLDRKTFAVRQTLSDLVELARLETPAHRVVDIDLQVTGDARICADAKLFQRAVENLLRNAVKYARHKVLLEVIESQEQLCVAVHDDGPGIPESHREEVLNAFFRIDPERNRKTGGVGLGLAIVGRIMSRHEGTVFIDDSPLGGAKVTLEWPNNS